MSSYDVSKYDEYMKQQKTKQGVARRRNWLKARIISIAAIDREILTNEEIKYLSMIHQLKKRLLDNWDKGSTELGMKVKPKKNLEDEIR